MTYPIPEEQIQTKKEKDFAECAMSKPDSSGA